MFAVWYVRKARAKGMMLLRVTMGSLIVGIVLGILEDCGWWCVVAFGVDAREDGEVGDGEGAVVL